MSSYIEGDYAGVVKRIVKTKEKKKERAWKLREKSMINW